MPTLWNANCNKSWRQTFCRTPSVDRMYIIRLTDYGFFSLVPCQSVAVWLVLAKTYAHRGLPVAIGGLRRTEPLTVLTKPGKRPMQEFHRSGDVAVTMHRSMDSNTTLSDCLRAHPFLRSLADRLFYFVFPLDTFHLYSMSHYQGRSQQDGAGAAQASSYPAQPHASSSQQTVSARPDSPIYPTTEYPAKAYQSQSTPSEPWPQSKEGDEQPAPTPAKRQNRKLQAVISHLKNHVGVGIVCSVAYFDP